MTCDGAALYSFSLLVLVVLALGQFLTAGFGGGMARKGVFFWDSCILIDELMPVMMITRMEWPF